MHGDTLALVMLFMFRLKPADRGRTNVTNDLTPRPATFDTAVSGERDKGEAGTGRRSRLGQTEVVEVAAAALGSCGLLGADTATAPQRITVRPYKRAISSNDALAADGQPLLSDVPLLDIDTKAGGGRVLSRHKSTSAVFEGDGHNTGAGCNVNTKEEH
ncbi:unnamed protein product [Boreogadus saida]